VAVRRGTDEHLAAAGFRYFFTDAHLAQAGTFLGAYADIPLGAERFDAERQPDASSHPEARVVRTPYRAYRMAGAAAVAAYVRDPVSSLQVWSRHHGYPGHAAYLEFHKIRWPGGLKYWRVTGPDLDLGLKQAYEPSAARDRAAEHAAHFASGLAQIAREAGGEGAGVIVAPFDTELFGHWWFEGVDFIGGVYRRLQPGGPVRPMTAAGHVGEHPPRTVLRLAPGSWGANGDWSMWMNDRTRWTWERLWPLEDAFWKVAPAALASEAARPVLAQAARALLLAQSSDWQFIISTGAVTDYAERRFRLHCDDATRLVDALAPNAHASAIEEAQRFAEDLSRRDDLFPDILASVATALE
jgi:1,4-alpha-glucan branching enzyme